MILNNIEKYLFRNYNKYASEIYNKSKENPSKLNEKHWNNKIIRAYWFLVLTNKISGKFK